jgi:hypothetical protein
MPDPDSPSRGRLLFRLIVALAALLLAWLTDPNEFDPRPSAVEVGGRTDALDG